MPDDKSKPLSVPLDIPDFKFPDPKVSKLPDPPKPGQIEKTGKKSDLPASLSWGNVENLWREIRQAKETKNVEQWDAVVKKVQTSLEDWRKVINRWPDMARKYKIVQAIADRSEDEKKQEALDTIQKMREVMPVHIRKAIDAGHAVVPLKARTVEDLLHSLEGIRQGDYDAYSGSIKRELAQWEENQMVEQHKLQMEIRNLHDRLDGVQDEERRKKMLQRIPQVNSRIKVLSAELDREQNKDRQDRLTDTINDYVKEVKSINRRLTGTDNPETRAKLQVKINEAEMGLKTPERIKEELRVRAKDAKYDALLWLVTNIAHPEKVLKTKEPIQAQPIKPKYMPPEETMEREEEVEIEPPKSGASECRIFLSLITEGLFNKAKKYWLAPYTISIGDLVVLEDTRKGRIRSVNHDMVVVDCFDGFTLSMKAHQTQRYM